MSEADEILNRLKESLAIEINRFIDLVKKNKLVDALMLMGDFEEQRRMWITEAQRPHHVLTSGSFARGFRKTDTTQLGLLAQARAQVYSDAYKRCQDLLKQKKR
ncbi:MAG: hypothetical protein ABIJ08_00275 [Nanoarchaeota archaeon]